MNPYPNCLSIPVEDSIGVAIASLLLTIAANWSEVKVTLLQKGAGMESSKLFCQIRFGYWDKNQVASSGLTAS